MSPASTLNIWGSSSSPCGEVAADARDARIGVDLEQAVGRLVVAQRLLERVGAVDHAAELEHLERLAVAPDARLAKQHRAGESSLTRLR
jgi:hypothetical protein